MFRNRKIEINRFNGIQKPPKGGFFYSLFLRPSQFICVAVALIHSNVFYGQETLDKFVDGWHLSASKANLEEYFGATHETFVFLGTAPVQSHISIVEKHGISPLQTESGTSMQIQLSHGLMKI
jgi:hypothetical protein